MNNSPICSFSTDDISKNSIQNYNGSPFNNSFFNYTQNDMTKINDSDKIKIIESSYTEFDLSQTTNIYMFPQCTTDKYTNEPTRYT